MGQSKNSPSGQRTGFLGTLKDALAAASREDTGRTDPEKVVAASAQPEPMQLPPPLPAASDEAVDIEQNQAEEVDSEADTEPVVTQRAGGLSAADAAREARGGTVPIAAAGTGIEQVEETTRVAKDMVAKEEDASRTQLVRGKVEVARGQFGCDPVVGWLVVVGGPGIGAYRPVFEGNNSIGRALTQRIPIDFGDDAISSEEQAYIRYDSSDRSFLFVPNLAKTNVVSVNNARPTGAVELTAMDVIVMGRTQIVFVPFCGKDFDWSEIADK